MAPLLRLAVNCLLVVPYAIALPNGKPSSAKPLEPRAAGKCTAINPPPQGVKCGAPGYLVDPAYASDSQVVSNVNACRDLCARHTRNGKPSDYLQGAGCAEFSFDSDSHTCSFYWASFSDMGFTADPGSTLSFYSLKCYDCPSYCPQTVGQEVVDNGGFEANDMLAGPFTTSGGSITAPGHNSEHAFTCGRNCEISQLVQICGGNVYRMTFDYKAPRKVEASILAGKTSAQYGTLPATGSSWATYDYWFYGDQKTIYTIELSLSKATGVQIDNISVKRVDSAAFSPTGPESLVNGGFDTGQLAPWSYQRGGRVYNYKIVQPGLNGTSNAIRLRGFVTDDSGETLISQTVSNLVVGKNYLVSYTAVKKGSYVFFPDTIIGNTFYSALYFSAGKVYNFSLPYQARSTSERVAIQYEYGPLLVDSVSFRELA